MLCWRHEILWKVNTTRCSHFKVWFYRSIRIMLRKIPTTLQMGFLYVPKLFTEPVPSEMLLKFSYWILELPRLPNSFYPCLAVRFRAGSKFILALVFSPIRNRETVLQQTETDRKLNWDTGVWAFMLIRYLGLRERGRLGHLKRTTPVVNIITVVVILF